MSGHTTRQTVIVPIGLGAASRFDRDIFSLSLHRKRDNLSKGDLLLDATLEEMLNITNMGADPKQWEELISSTRARHDQLLTQKERLVERSKTKNLFKIIANYRAIRLFLHASETLYLETVSRSDQMRRSMNKNLLPVPCDDLQPAGDELPPDATVTGIAVSLDGPLDEATEKTITDAANTFASFADPFADNPFVDQPSSDSDWDAYSVISAATVSDIGAADRVSSATSPASQSPGSNINHHYYFFRNSVVAQNSNVHGATLNHGGLQNSGSVNNQIQMLTPEMSS